MRFISVFKVLFSALSCVLLTQCGTIENLHEPQLSSAHYRSFDGREFPYQKWDAKANKPDAKRVVIALHGYNGYPGDFEWLATKLNADGCVLYAPATRGQGFDPLEKCRGDIGRSQQWVSDLRAMTQLLRAKYPNSELVWLGESMGGLIALNSISENQNHSCDKLIIAAPIFGVENQITAPQKTLFGIASTLFPSMRFSLAGLTGQNDTQMTHQSKHEEQVIKNDWHVERQTLRLYKNIGLLIQNAPAQLAQLQVPLLTLRGAKDSLSNKASLNSALGFLPKSTPYQHIEYENSHHLLFYDQEKEKVAEDFINWLRISP